MKSMFPTNPKQTGRRNRRGVALLMMVALFAVILGSAGLILDGGRLAFEKRRMQFAADAAAFAGAHEVYRGNTALVTPAARYDAKLNNFDDAASDITVTVNHPPLTGPRSGDLSYVEVVIARPIPMTFMRSLGRSSATVRARAVAGVIGDTAPPCILALNPSAQGALTVAGTATLFAPQCRIMVNSNVPGAITTNGGPCVTAKEIGYVNQGSWTANGGSCVVPTPIGKALPFPDPFMHLVEPPVTSVTKIANAVTRISNGQGTLLSPILLLPGYYKGGIKITGGFALFLPGLYIVDGMDFTGGTILGNNVTFINTANGLKNISINGSAAVNFHAPSTGYWKNILFFNSRTAPTGSNPYDCKVTGTAGSVFEGVHYFPTVEYDFGGNNVLVAPWAMMIADTYKVHGTPNLAVWYGDNSPYTPATARSALTE